MATTSGPNNPFDSGQNPYEYARWEMQHARRRGSTEGAYQWFQTRGEPIREGDAVISTTNTTPRRQPIFVDDGPNISAAAFRDLLQDHAVASDAALRAPSPTPPPSTGGKTTVELYRKDKENGGHVFWELAVVPHISAGYVKKIDGKETRFLYRRNTVNGPVSRHKYYEQ